MVHLLTAERHSSYDRFASIFPTRRQAFKCIITWLLLVTHMLYGTFSVALTYIKYSVGYM